MKKFFRQAHIYTSVFFLPLALIYAFTGMLYIFGITDKTGVTTTELPLSSPLPKETAPKIESLKAILAENNLEMPSDIEFKKTRNGEMIGSIKYSVSIDEKAQKLSVTKRNTWACLVLLHKAKGGYYFNILAVAFSIALILLYFSGFIITSWCKNTRKSSLLVLFGGIIVTILGIIFSI